VLVTLSLVEEMLNSCRVQDAVSTCSGNNNYHRGVTDMWTLRPLDSEVLQFFDAGYCTLDLETGNMAETVP